MDVEQYTEYLIQRLCVDDEQNSYWVDFQFYNDADEAINRLLNLRKNMKELTFRAVERSITDGVLSV